MAGGGGRDYQKQDLVQWFAKAAKFPCVEQTRAGNDLEIKYIIIGILGSIVKLCPSSLGANHLVLRDTVEGTILVVHI